MKTVSSWDTDFVPVNPINAKWTPIGSLNMHGALAVMTQASTDNGSAPNRLQAVGGAKRVKGKR